MLRVLFPGLIGGAVAFATPVLAEVCDKTRPGWVPIDGPVSQLSEAMLFLMSPLGIGLVILTAAAYIWRKWWLTSITLALMSLIALQKALAWAGISDSILPAAIEEGCRGRPLLIIAGLAGLAYLLIQRTLPRLTERKNTLDIDDDLGGIEIVQDIEKNFDIKIEDHEAEEIRTVGDLFDLIQGKLGQQDRDALVWAFYERILRDHISSPDPIDRDTTFFAAYAKPRSESR